MHLNIQSMLNKYNELEVLVSDTQADALCLTETWLTTDATNTANIPDYELIANYCRDEHIHGGTAIYVKNGIKAKKLSFVAQYSVEMHLECCGVLLYQNDGYKTVLLSIYRPPAGDIEMLLTNLSTILVEVTKLSSRVVICGDLNIDSLKATAHSKLLDDLLKSFDMTDYCNEPTRIAVDKNQRKTETSIDYMVTNLPHHLLECKIFEPHLSDHTAQILIISTEQLEETPKKQHRTIKKRCITDNNIANLKYRLAQETWNEANSENVDEAFEGFLNTFLWLYNITCPEYDITIKTEKINKKWVSDEIRTSSRNLKDMYHLTKTQNSEELNELYKDRKKAHRKLINETKKTFNANLIQNADNKPKQIWKIVRDELGQSKQKNQIIIKNEDGELIKPEDIPETFGNYFSTIAQKKLTDHFDDKISESCTTLPNSSQSMSYIPITAQDVIKIIKNLPNKKSCGSDGVLIKVIKGVCEVIAAPLAAIINKSIQCGVFPNCLKLAIVIPIFKKGDETSIENYRPISLLSIFSKIFERVMYNNIVSFTNKYQLVSDTQHGFREKRSTETASFHFIEYVHKQLDQNKYVAGLFFDLSRAFDTIDIKFVEQKLYCIGIRSNLLEWIISFLSNRKQCVRINNNISSQYNIDIGAAQGSVLAPLIFILYINDLKLSGFMINFADDTSVIASAATREQLELSIETIKYEMNEWCFANRLILNADKTIYVHFYRSIPVLPLDTLSDHVKFLGTYINSNLSWANQINYASKKLNTAYFALLKLKLKVPHQTLVDMYYAMVYPHISYNIVLWGQASDIKRVFIIQKRILRLIFDLKRIESCRNTFKKYKILTLYSIFIYKCALFVYNHKNNFKTNKDTNIHYSTRGASNLSTPAHNTKKYEKSPYYSCLKVFNNLPATIKIIPELNKYKRELKKYLIEHCYYDSNEYFNRI